VGEISADATTRATMSRMNAVNVSQRARTTWASMGGKLGMGFAAGGFLLILLAWNGAAGLDYTQGQMPYLISGGLGGVGLIVLGAALIVTESVRRDRAELERRISELSSALGRLAPSAAAAAPARSTTVSDLVVTGRSSFHRPDCHLVAGRDDAELVERSGAEADGLVACRVCNP